MEPWNGSFREVALGQGYLESVPTHRALWYETEEDRHRRHAFKDFFQNVRPVVWDLIDGELTVRQQQVVRLYFLCGKSQEDIAIILDLSQSTVSRHLFGTVRDGKKVGGAIPKLRKAIEKGPEGQLVSEALSQLQSKLAASA